MLGVVLNVALLVALSLKVTWQLSAFFCGVFRPSGNRVLALVQVGYLFLAYYLEPVYLWVVLADWILFVVKVPGHWYMAFLIVVDLFNFWLFTRQAWLDVVDRQWGWLDEPQYGEWKGRDE